MDGRKEHNKMRTPFYTTISLFILFSFITIDKSWTDEAYTFERMWPTLIQPWYFNDPNGITVDRKGNVYVADTMNHRIQKFSSTGDFITKWGRKGDENGEFNHPSGIAVDSRGNIYIADTGNHRIIKIHSNGTSDERWSRMAVKGNSMSPMGLPWTVRAMFTRRI